MRHLQLLFESPLNYVPNFVKRYLPYDWWVVTGGAPQQFYFMYFLSIGTSHPSSYGGQHRLRTYNFVTSVWPQILLRFVLARVLLFWQQCSFHDNWNYRKNTDNVQPYLTFFSLKFILLSINNKIIHCKEPTAAAVEHCWKSLKVCVIKY